MSASTLATSDVVRARLSGSKRDLKGVAFEVVLLLALLVSLAILITLLADVARGALSVFSERGSAFLSSPLSSLPQRAGVYQGLAGSFSMLLIVVVVAFPLGIAAAVYLEEYASDTRLNRLLALNIRNLAGVPSIVYGLLGLAIFVKALGGLTGGASLLTGGLTLAVLVLPIVIITASEALRAVPVGIREAAYGIGATRWQVIRSHVVPYAAPGILTGTVLSLSRALGETAPLLLVGAVTGFLATGGGSPLDQLRGPFTSLPTIVFAWARQPSADFRALTSAAVVVLLVMILVANAAAIFLRNRYERRW